MVVINPRVRLPSASFVNDGIDITDLFVLVEELHHDHCSDRLRQVHRLVCVAVDDIDFDLDAISLRTTLQLSPPGEIRTPDIRFRKATFCPLNYGRRFHSETIRCGMPASFAALIISLVPMLSLIFS